MSETNTQNPAENNDAIAKAAQDHMETPAPMTMEQQMDVLKSRVSAIEIVLGQMSLDKFKMIEAALLRHHVIEE
jgi:hypothetical protein